MAGRRFGHASDNADNEDYVNYGWSRKQRPVLIAGPTASGKSALALALAERYGGVVINADASQVYGCWRILTARPDAADLARAPHRLYGHVACDADYSVGHWLRDATAAIAEAERAGQRPIIVGGTGLYFHALTRGLARIPPIPPEIRAAFAAMDLAAHARGARSRDRRPHRPRATRCGCSGLGRFLRPPGAGWRSWQARDRGAGDAGGHRRSASCSRSRKIYLT